MASYTIFIKLFRDITPPSRVLNGFPSFPLIVPNPKNLKLQVFGTKPDMYAVYTTTRLNSLLTKLDTKDVKINDLTNEDVKNIAVKLTELPKALTSSYKDVSLNYICEFIYDLSSLYNKFYTNNNISQCENSKDKETFIAISKLTYNVLSRLLNVLGIDLVERM